MPWTNDAPKGFRLFQIVSVTQWFAGLRTTNRCLEFFYVLLCLKPASLFHNPAMPSKKFVRESDYKMYLGFGISFSKAKSWTIF